MPNINNTLTTNHNGALSMNDLGLKSWCPTLHIIPPSLTACTSNKNRISPLTTKSAAQEPISPSLSHLFKKITRTPTRTPTRTLSRSSTMMNHATWKKDPQNVYIYLKSPHVVACGELAGSIVVHGDTALVHKIKSIKLDLVGLEAVHDSDKSIQKSYSFLNTNVLQLTGSEQVAPYYHYYRQGHDVLSSEDSSKIIVPFLVSLPSDLSGTYTDKKASIQYYLESQVQWYLDKPTLQKQAVIVYSNMVLKSLQDAATLYTPVLLNKKQVWNTTHKDQVSLEAGMPRSVWMSGAPIYVTVKIQNETLNDMVNDIRLELLRKQNTYFINTQDQSLIPITMSCETIAITSLAGLGWWKPVEPASQDQVTLTIDTPSNQVTIRNQKLIDVSFSIRLSVQSLLNANTVVFDMPVMLVHPISMDPPPGNYTKAVTSASNTEDCHLILQQAVSKIATQSATSISPSTLSCTQSSSTRPSNKINIQPRRKFNIMKKNISRLGLQISRKMSISSGLSSQSESDQQSTHTSIRPKLRISLPLMSSSSPPLLSPSSPSSSSLSIRSSVCSKTSDSVESDSVNEGISKIIKSKELQEENPRKSTMKFGQIIGPKRFGQQPGCLGDAGLDIRNCFNVATATEAIQSYAAEKVELSSRCMQDVTEEGNYCMIPPYLEPTQFTELTNKKGFIIAPHSEKCQIDPEMMSRNEIQQYENEHYDLPKNVIPLGETQLPQYSSNSCKRMLASSRHLQNLQRKSVHMSKNGHSLLAKCQLKAIDTNKKLD